MATASDEFLVRLRYWLVSGGMITRSASGTVTSRRVCAYVSPSAREASFRPRGTARMPARTISAMKAPVYMTSPNNSATYSGESDRPPE